MPATLELHDTIAVPDPVTLPGVIAPQARPEGTISVRFTSPLKPFTADIVIVEEVDVPALTGTGDAAVVVKS